MEEENRIKGKRNRASGQRFERKVRKDLESQGWIVDKWSNNVEFFEEEIPDDDGIPSIGKLISAKRKYNPFKKVLGIGTGFPDFIIYNRIGVEKHGRYKFPTKMTFKGVKLLLPQPMYRVIGVECKTNGYLDKIEKAKCKWLLDNNIFGKIIIASKGKKYGTIKYVEFEEKNV